MEEEQETKVEKEEHVQFPGTEKELNSLLYWTTAGDAEEMGRMLREEYLEAKRVVGVDFDEYFDEWYDSCKQALGDSGEDPLRITKGVLKSYISSFVLSETREREEVYEYLNLLRESGVTNMFGATPYLQKEFGFNFKEAKTWLLAWMKDFG